MNKQISNRLIGIDILRVVAMLFVVFLHTIYGFTLRTDFFLTKAWFVFEPFSAISQSSLALFFIVSGYLVIHKNRTAMDNLKITLYRIVIPLISFSILYALFYLFKTKQNPLIIFSPIYLFGDILKFPNNYLWFLQVLLFLYILNPLWQGIFSDKTKQNEARYITIFFFLFTCTITILKYTTNNLFILNSFTTWIGYLCCYLYGGLLRNNWGWQLSKNFYFFIFIVGLVIEILGNYFSILNQMNGTPFQFGTYFTDNMAIPPFLMAIGLFNILIDVKNIEIANKQVSIFRQKFIQTFATLSYGIYLTHIFISQSISDILEINIDSAHTNAYIFNISFFAVTLFGAAIVTYIISRIPKLRMIIGCSS
jgi:surface polysaccharide O-acyltransferase-like enzyme